MSLTCAGCRWLFLVCASNTPIKPERLYYANTWRCISCEGIPTVEVDPFDPASCKPIFVAPHPPHPPHYPLSNNTMMTTCPLHPGTPHRPLCPRQRASYRLLSPDIVLHAVRHTSASAVCFAQIYCVHSLSSRTSSMLLNITS